MPPNRLRCDDGWRFGATAHADGSGPRAKHEYGRLPDSTRNSRPPWDVSKVYFVRHGERGETRLKYDSNNAHVARALTATENEKKSELLFGLSIPISIVNFYLTPYDSRDTERASRILLFLELLKYLVLFAHARAAVAAAADEV